MKICVIAHGGKSTGMGHVVRCLALAQEFRRQGHAVFFISKYAQGIQKIQEQAFPVYRIAGGDSAAGGFFFGDESALQDEWQQAKRVLQENRPDAVLLDSYNVTPWYFLELKKYTGYVAYIDDVNRFVYPVDMLINGTASALDMQYTKYRAEEILLLGLPYNLIREEFRDLPSPQIRGEICDILITTGSSDPHQVTQTLIGLLSAIPTTAACRLHAIVGAGFSNLDFPASPRLFLYPSPPQMSDIMRKCDIAISAGGSTLYELAACGIPTLAFAYADNQIPQMRALSRDGVLYDLGSYAGLDIQKLEKGIHFLRNPADRQVLSAKLQNLVDGEGPSRVVKAICG